MLELIWMNQQGPLAVMTLDIGLWSKVRDVQDIIRTDNQSLPWYQARGTHLSLKAFMTLCTSASL
jgi:hypothetical protein